MTKSEQIIEKALTNYISQIEADEDRGHTIAELHEAWFKVKNKLRTLEEIVSQQADDYNLKIEAIKFIIQKWGAFTIADIEADHSPCIGSYGNFVHLAEDFMEDRVAVEVYNPHGFSSDSIDQYELEYEELSPEVIDEILEMAQTWEQQSIDNYE